MLNYISNRTIINKHDFIIFKKSILIYEKFQPISWIWKMDDKLFIDEVKQRKITAYIYMEVSENKRDAELLLEP